MRAFNRGQVARWLLGAIAMPALLIAAPRLDRWDAVGRLDPGTPIKIVTGANAQSGEFVSASTEALTIRTAQGERRFARPEVLRVEVVSGRSHRLRNTLIGAAVGVGISVAADATIGAYMRNESNSPIVRPLIWTLPIAAGAGIGAIAGGHAVVYRK